MKKIAFLCLTSSIACSLAHSPLSADAVPSACFKQQAHSKLKPWMLEFQKNLPALPADLLSNAEPEKAVTTHLIWEVEPDFVQKKLLATATYTYQNKKEDNDRLMLDVSNLRILDVKVNGSSACFEIVPSELEGRPDALQIAIPASQGEGTVQITYRTTQASTSVFWIDPEYTHGKGHPLLYTLFQANEGASAIPGQHSPQVRMTYEVKAKTQDADLMVLSSVSNNPRKRNPTGEYSGLVLNRAVPLYLLSLQIGHFSFQGYEQDARTGVYAEDAMLEQVVKAFDFLPGVMKAAEDVCGPYNWGAYTPILLSWAFPYMAMEHPCASTCGAISLEHPSVIPHELAHSWAGNDITNATWQQFFWNEGLTTYLEYQICSKVWGQDYASLTLLYTLEEMQSAMDEYRSTKPDLLRLCQQTCAREFSRIPYGKGALFFFMLEKTMGAEVFQRFLKDYMNIFFENSMSDARFLAYLRLWLAHETDVDPEAFIAENQVLTWLYDLEIPFNAPTFSSKIMDEFTVQRTKLLQKEPIDQEKMNSWDITTQAYFLSSLLGKVSPSDLALLDSQCHLTQSKTMSIREEWARLCASCSYLTEETSQMIVDYLIERNSAHKANQVSLFLNKSEAGRQVIQKILDQENGRLFPLIRQKIEKNFSSSL